MHVKRFPAPGPWITRDLKDCVLASEHDAEVARLEERNEYLGREFERQCLLTSRAEARLAEAERDAARYRWLRDCSNGEIDWPRAAWDAAIDVEIAADSAPEDK